MFSVVITEDELPLLRGLKKMIETLNPRFRVVMSAKNGKEAIDYMEEHPVDVIFTDINMPIADGIEVLKYTVQSTYRILSVVISGYNDFTYAQKAIQYQAKNYLLKPIEREELRILLEELERELDKNSNDRKQKTLTDALFGQAEAVDNGLFQGTLYPYYFCAGPFTSELTEELSMGNDFWRKNNLKTIAERVCPPECGVFTFWGKSVNEMILIMEGGTDYDSRDMAYKILQGFSGELPVAAAFRAGVTDVRNLKDACFSLRRDLRNRAAFGKSLVLEGQERPETVTLLSSERSALQIALKKGQPEEIRRILTGLKDRMAQAGVTQNNLESVLNEIYSLVHETAADGCGGLSGTDESDTADMVTGSYTLEQVFEDFINLCQSFTGDICPPSGQDLMKQVDGYIREHIGMPLTTKMLAARFGLVAPYLSRLFKEYKGESPSQYIQNIRIQNAKELLIRYPEMLAKDIAETVGYSNPLYFSKTFNRTVGMYPSEYRMRHKNREAETQ